MVVAFGSGGVSEVEGAPEYLDAPVYGSTKALADGAEGPGEVAVGTVVGCVR